VTGVEFGDWPGRIVFGAGTVGRLGAEVSNLGASRALVICGSTVARGPMLAKVKSGLGDVAADVFSEVTGHTPIEMVKRGAARARANKSDILISVGGGSAIDAGKAIAIDLASRRDLARYAIQYQPGGAMRCERLPGPLIPHIAVPTTAGSASDVMPTAGCRDARLRQKLLFWDHRLVPQVAILDPEMAAYADARLTAASGMSAVARSIESIYSGKRHPLSTGLALHALRLLRTALPRSIQTPDDLEARAACQMAALMSGMAAINAMVSLVHAIGHVVGGRYGLAHGTSHAILLASAVRLLMPAIGDEQPLVCAALTSDGMIPTPDQKSATPADLIAAFVARLPLPQRLRDVGVEKSDLGEVAQAAMSDYMMANLPRPVTENEVRALLQEAW
jgi:alcohol dehydrogenase class IV